MAEPLTRVELRWRPDGLIDVLRERASGGERILGCRTLEDAFEMVRAVATESNGTDKENET